MKCKWIILINDMNKTDCVYWTNVVNFYFLFFKFDSWEKGHLNSESLD